jgi:hypothetical protein
VRCSASTSKRAYRIFRPAPLPMKRRSCSLVARPCHAGCFWKVCDAHVETERFHIGATEVGAEAGLLESAPEVTFLFGVTEARQSDIEPLRTK